MKKVLFIDRDGTLILEPDDYQVNTFEKLVFYPEVFHYLGKIATELDFEMVMVTNQDGLGTAAYPETVFSSIQDFILKSFANEGIVFSNIFIDRSFPEQNSPMRKPKTGMLTSYLDTPDYDLTGSFVIGDRMTDVELAKNLGCKAIFITDHETLGSNEVAVPNNPENKRNRYYSQHQSGWNGAKQHQHRNRFFRPHAGPVGTSRAN